MVVARAAPAHGLEQAKRAVDVGVQKWCRVRDGVVVVRLGRKVYDGVMPGNQTGQELGVADVAYHKLHALGRQPRDVGGVSGVGELVQHRDVHVGVLSRHVAHEAAAHEAAAARDQDVMRLKRSRHAMHPLQRSAVNVKLPTKLAYVWLLF